MQVTNHSLKLTFLAPANGWQRKTIVCFLLGWPIFRCYVVSFGEGIFCGEFLVVQP